MLFLIWLCHFCKIIAKTSTSNIEKMKSDCLTTETLQGEFTDTGTETHFTLDGYSSCIRAESSGSRHRGLTYVLVIGNTALEPIREVVT